MNRKYDTKYFLDKINVIRSIRPDISITTDVIVGFPGETKEEFNETCEFSKKIGFSKIHVFPYSRRSGTKADTMPNQIDEQVKKEVLGKKFAHLHHSDPYESQLILFLYIHYLLKY